MKNIEIKLVTLFFILVLVDLIDAAIKGSFKLEDALSKSLILLGLIVIVWSILKLSKKARSFFSK